MSVAPCKSSWTKIFVLGMVLIVTGTISSAQTYTVIPSSLSFTGAPVGMLSLAKTVTIYNTGTTSLTVNSYSLSPEFVLIYGWAPYVIGPGKQFAFGIKFAPDAAGSFSGQFTVNLSGTDVVIPITGKGLSTRALPSVTPAEISFGEVPIGTTSTPQVLTVKNVGATSMKVLAVTADPPFNVTGPAYPALLKAGQSLNLQVTFMGTTAQEFSDVLTILYDVVPQTGISLSATATPQTSLTVNVFSPLPTATVSSAYLTPLTPTGGTPPYTWSVTPDSSLPTGLALSSSGTISGTLDPAVTVGSYSFNVQVTDSTGAIATTTSPLSLAVAPLTGSNCNDIYFNVRNTQSPMVPLTDLGTLTYQGYEGGLYPDGTNSRPIDHDLAGNLIAQSIQPLDADGNPDSNGKIGLLSIGMSATFDTFVRFMSDFYSDPARNPHLVLVPGAQPRAEAALFADPNNGAWNAISQSFLPQSGITANQVVAAWVDDVDSRSTGTFPSDIATLQPEFESIAQNLHSKFPNLQLLYFGSRIYAGDSNFMKKPPQDPEPYAYESGFAVKWTIEDQINGNPSLNYDPTKGLVMAPWMSWGAYTWANGLMPRADGMAWTCQDLMPDGTHVNDPNGRQKEANLMMQFFKSDSTTVPWFLSTDPRQR